MLASSVVDRGFIGGVMGSMFASSVVDRGFIGGVMGSMLTSSVVTRGAHDLPHSRRECDPLHHR
jgi:fructose-specific phosphotransferase system IIC component